VRQFSTRLTRSRRETRDAGARRDFVCVEDVAGFVAPRGCAATVKSGQIVDAHSTYFIAQVRGNLQA